MFNSSSYGHDPNFLPSFGPPNSAAAAAFFEGSPAFSSSPPYSSSLPSDNYFLHRRSNSTHSLTHQQQQQHYGIPEPTPPPFFSAASASPSSSAPCGFLDFHSEPVVRRVFSTGDLQGMNATQASTENSAQEASPAAGRVGRYSAEERRERIERYRNKRNQRNFHKKITYACRKTLADSRPRVRGRFARNGETEAEAEATEMIGLEGSCSNYNSCDTDAGNVDQLWRQMQAALATADEEEECCFDEDVLWASFDNVFSMNLLSFLSLFSPPPHKISINWNVANFVSDCHSCVVGLCTILCNILLFHNVESPEAKQSSPAGYNATRFCAIRD